MAYLFRSRIRRLVLDELDAFKASTRNILAPDFIYRPEGADIAPDAVVRDVLNRGDIKVGHGAYVSEVVVEEDAELIVEDNAFVFDLVVSSGHKVRIRSNSTVRSSKWTADIDFEGVAIGTSFTNLMALTLKDAVLAFSSGALNFATPLTARGLTMVRASVVTDRGATVSKLGDNLTLCKNKMLKIDMGDCDEAHLAVLDTVYTGVCQLGMHIGGTADLDIGNDVWVSLGLHYESEHPKTAKRTTAHVGDRSRILGAYGTISDMDVTLGQDSVYVDWHDTACSYALNGQLTNTEHGKLIVAPGQVCHKASARPTVEYVANPGEAAMWW